MCSLLDLVTRLDAHGHQGTGHFVLDPIEQLTKQLKGFALVFLLGLLLRITAKVNALAQVIQRTQMLSPMGVDALQQNHALKRDKTVTARLIQLGLELRMGCSHHHLQDVFLANGAGVLNFGLEF